VRLFLALAFRNVFRNRVRTAVALFAIATGAAALIVNGGVIYNIFRELREDAIHGRHGHMQVYRRGYTENHRREPARYLLSRLEADRVVALAKALPHVARVTRRREFTGMISRADRFVAFVGIGVEPEEDPEFSRHMTMKAGRSLSPEDPHGVVAGLGLSQKIDATPGAPLTLTANTSSGALNATEASLRGVFEGGLKEYDDWTLKVPLGTAEELLGDDRIEQIVILLDRTENVPVVLPALEAAFQKDGLDLEVKPWNELALFHNQVVSLFRRELDVIKLIISTIVILGIANTIGMSIVERRMELATLRALGLRPGVIGRLLMTEALITGLLGGGLGVLLGIGIAVAASAIGIPFPSPPGATRPFLGGVDIVPGIVLFSFVLSVAATLAAAAFPVFRALKRPIAATLRGA
jgi:putative ABC transport system permease protein